MKKIFKLAAIAVSVALAASLVACSSGDDDVVDASTPKYLLTAQIDNCFASIEYNQNVSDKEIESFEKVHEEMMTLIGDCEKLDCLAVYLDDLKYLTDKFDENGLTSDDIKIAENYLTKCIADNVEKKYGTHDKYNKVRVYKPAIWDALEEVQPNKYTVGGVDYYLYGQSDIRAKVLNIGNPNGDTILKGALNERQTASMTAYTDAVAALKAVLSEDDAKKCETKIKAADDAIKTFNDLKNANVTTDKIEKVVDAVDAMYTDILVNVYNEIESKGSWETYSTKYWYEQKQK